MKNSKRFHTDILLTGSVRSMPLALLLFCIVLLSEQSMVICLSTTTASATTISPATTTSPATSTTTTTTKASTTSASALLAESSQPSKLFTQTSTSQSINRTEETTANGCWLADTAQWIPLDSVWVSPKYPCVIHKCELNQQGVAEETPIIDDCSGFVCDAESEVQPKQGSCCGECVRTKCSFNNQVYSIGQTWHNKETCTILECDQLPNGQPIINAYQKSCPALPKDCPLEKQYVKDCCTLCNDTKSELRFSSDFVEVMESDDIWTEEFYSKHPCVRDCQSDAPAQTCHYTFVVEWYETLSKACFDCPKNATDCLRPHCIAGDGIPRSITVVNRMMPGPSIEVCQNDMIVVDVKNHLLGESTTIHWHGMHMKSSPYMDGVPHITQCPISPHSTFRYSFKAENVGTHFWHSHTGMQRGDGVFGALIIRRPRSMDPHGHLYDFDLSEHKMIVQDWVHVPGVSMFSSHHHSFGDNKPFNLLLNGRGRYYKQIWQKIKETMGARARSGAEVEAETKKSVETNAGETEQSEVKVSETAPSSSSQETSFPYTENPKTDSGNTPDEASIQDEVIFLHPFNNGRVNKLRIQDNVISRLARVSQFSSTSRPQTTEQSHQAQEPAAKPETQEKHLSTLHSTSAEQSQQTAAPEPITNPEQPEKHIGKRSVMPDIPLDLIPLQKYTVQRGFRYRFRIINAEFLNCPIKISIDNHSLLALSSDGYDFEPVDVGSIVTYAGERFDFVVTANQAVGNYWIRLKGLMDCDERFTSAFQVAVLHYEGAADDVEPTGKELGYEHEPTGLELNAMNKGSGHVDSLTIAELSALSVYDRVPGIDRHALKPVADYKFFVYYDFYPKDNPIYHTPEYYPFDAVNETSKRLTTPQLNHISLKFPSVALLPARDQLSDDQFCNETSLQQKGIDCRKEFCKCHHVLQVPLDAIVELIIVDEGFTFDANHPFHLHGNAFRVVGLERLGSNVTVELVKQLDRFNLLKRNLNNPPVKDTVTIPDGGYTIIRFEAANPGFWLFHCHIEFHAEIGMALVLKVGENDEMLPVPKNFPTCHDYMPVDNDEEIIDDGDDDDGTGSVIIPPVGDNGAAARSFTSVLSFVMFAAILVQYLV